MKKIFNTLFLTLLAASTFAQVPRTIVVEHFTNTRCGVCSSRNPGFYTNLDAHAGILHMSVHPSSPYSSCVLNQHNSSENDDRTNYYGIYGGTPRLVIQGDVVPVSSNYGAATIFDAYENETTAFSLALYPAIRDVEDSLYLRVDIIKQSSSSLTEATLFAAAVEEVVDYSAPNGETEHHDVFRKSYFDTEGITVTLPTNVGDTLSYDATINVHADWDLSQIFGLAILQETSDKSVLQATSSEGMAVDTIETGIALGTIENVETDAVVFPNPFDERLIIEGSDITKLELLNVMGQTVWSNINPSNRIEMNTSHLPAGQYVLRLENQLGASRYQKLIKR